MVHDERIGTADQIFQLHMLSCDDQILQLDGSVVLLLPIHHIDRGNVIIFSGLTHQLPHGLPDGQIVVNQDKIGGHITTDLILVVGQQKPDVLAGLFVQHPQNFTLCIVVHFLQDVHRVVGIHLGNDFRLLL